MFTTKEVGKGTGLGLSIVHNIIIGGFGGDIAVSSKPNQGATFTVTLPTATR
jgi:signal transduction histidine kinase